MFQEERAKFKRWLADRQAHFDEINADPHDIADIAIQVGFSRIIVREWESHKRWEDMKPTS